MYWDKVKFKNSDNFKEFKVTFGNGDLKTGVVFKKNRDCFITSLSANIELEKNLKELKNYDQIKKISEISNSVLENGIGHLNKDKNLEINLENKIDLTQDKTKRKLSIKTLEFLDEKTKKKKIVSIYSPYEELKLFGLRFQNKDASIYKYTIDLLQDEKNDKIYLEKRIFFNKNEIIEQIKKQYDKKNTFFIRNNGKLKAIKLEITDFLVENIDRRLNFDFMRILKQPTEFKLFFKNILFHGDNGKKKRRLPYIFTKGHASALTDLHPIGYTSGNLIIKGGVDFYITPELYEKKNSIFKRVPEIPSITLTQTELNEIRRDLQDNDFTASKLYGFRNKKTYSVYQILSLDDFVIPDFNVPILLKKGKEKIDDDSKKIFEGSFYILDNKINTLKTTEIVSKNKRITTIKNIPPENLQESLGDQYIFLKNLIKKVDLKSLTYAYENFFLYDLENMIKPTFTTELQKEFSIFGLINFSGENKKNNKLNLISPQNSLKFELERDVYKSELKLELNKVHSKKTFDIVGEYILNFGILSTKKKKKIGEKRIMDGEIIDFVNIIGIQNVEYEYLNPINVKINSESIIRKLMKNKNNTYRFVLQSLVFSSNILNDTDVIFLVSSGLNDVKQVFIKDKLEDTIGVCYLTEIKDWKIIKGESKRTQAVFSDSEDLTRQTNHFAFSFTTRNLADLLKFSITLIDGENKIIKFPKGEDKLPIINYQIQIMK